MLRINRCLWPVLVLSALAFAPGCSRSGKAVSGLNLLVITLDTTRADAVGLYSGRHDVTPNIDALGRQGVVFRECYTPVPLTLPAHCSLFTGRYPIGHLVRNNGTYVLGEEVTTMAEAFRDRGFETAAFIASFTVASKFGLGQGFDSYEENLESGSPFQNFNTEIPADRVAARFVRWLDRRPAGRFFSWVHFYDPHHPYLAHPEAPLPEAASNRHRYQGEVTYVDRYVGRIVEALKAKGLYEKTLIVIVGDHGEAFGEHGEYGHGIFCYEESLRVPLIMHNPVVLGKPAVLEGRVSLVDVMPTVLELFGIGPVEGVQGRSLLEGVRRGRLNGESLVYIESLFGREENNWAPLTGLIEGKYKFISLPEPELYDLEQDPGESRNLAASMPEAARGLDRRLRDFVAADASTGRAERRSLSEPDLQKLTALGYVSAFSGRAGSLIDPKSVIGAYAAVAEANAVLESGGFEEAEKRLQAALAARPGLELPDIYKISYEIRKHKGDRQGAKDVLTRAVKAFPARESFRIFLVREYMDEGKWEEAASLCRSFIEENDRMTAAWIMLGDAEMGRGDAAAAAGDFEKALALEPANTALGFRYFNALATAGDLGRAEAFLQKLQADEETAGSEAYVEAVSDLGLKLFFSGERQRGLEWLEKACSLAPDVPGVWVNRGAAYFHEGRLDQALADYRKALSLDEKSAQAHANIGVLYAARFAQDHNPGLLSQALASLNRAIELDPALGAAYNGRGSVHMAWGEAAAAAADFEKAVRLDPGLGDAYINLAEALQTLGRYGEALKYLDLFKARFYGTIPAAAREEVEGLYKRIKEAQRGARRS